MDTTYAQLTDLRLFAGVPTDGDELLQLILNTAAGLVDDYCNTTFVPTTVIDEVHDGTGTQYILLLHRPVVSVTSVKIDDVELASDSYEVAKREGHIVMPDITDEDRNPRIWRSCQSAQWPRGERNIKVTYSYGYSSVPEAVKMATCLTAATMYQSNLRQGIASESRGPRSVSYSPAHNGVPSSARQALDRYRESEVVG
jgi:hypothetical protein